MVADGDKDGRDLRRPGDGAGRAGRRHAAVLQSALAALPLLFPPALFTLDPEIPVLW